MALVEVLSAKYHWKFVVESLDAATVNDAGRPTQAVALAGCVSIVGRAARAIPTSANNRARIRVVCIEMTGVFRNANRGWAATDTNVRNRRHAWIDALL